MWTNRERGHTARGFSTPPASVWNPRPRLYSGIPQSAPAKRGSDPFHVVYKVPAGDSPYVKAKHVQLIDKDPSRAISLFWAAINSGDRVNSALKDMAVVMKQLDRSDEAIEAIKSFRHLCPHESQEPLDNILLELYKRSGRIEDQIKMLEIKVKSVEQGLNFGGKRVKPARSQGKKIYMTIEQQYSRLLGNLAWAYMQNSDFKSAEEHYRKALSLEPDKNKQCNLAICLMHMKRITEAKLLLRTIQAPSFENGKLVDDESYTRSLERATEMLNQLELNSSTGYPCPSPVIQTQPRRCSESVKGEHRKRSFLRDDNRCARKLAFGEENTDVSSKNGTKNEENVGKDKGNYFSTLKSKSSWADMAEEEEGQGPCKERQFSFQTQPREGFNNENSDSNVMIIAPIKERGEFRVNSNLVSSLVNFVEDEKVDEYYDCGNGITLLKRSSKRLQVFRDITSTSGSRHGI